MGITKSIKSENSSVRIEEYTSEGGQKFLIVSKSSGSYDGGCAVSCVQIFDDGAKTKREIRSKEYVPFWGERKE